MKKVLFSVIFALLAVFMMVGCSGETKTVDSVANYEILADAVDAIELLQNAFKKSTSKSDIAFTTETQFDNYVLSKCCIPTDYVRVLAEGRFSLTTWTDPVLSSRTDAVLTVTEALNAVVYATDTDGNPKTVTFSMNKGDKIESKCIKYDNGDKEKSNTIDATINGVYSKIEYIKKFYGELDYARTTATVNGSKVKESLLHSGPEFLEDSFIVDFDSVL